MIYSERQHVELLILFGQKNSMDKSLQYWNRRCSEIVPPNVSGWLAALLTVVLFLTYFQFRGWMNVPPSTAGDEPHYDSIGWELSRGRGFQIDFSNPEFREFYDRSENPGGPLPPQSRSDRIPDTTRPPLFPVLISCSQFLAGRQLWGTRLWNILCMAVTCGLTVRFVAKRFGTLPALVVLPLFVLLDVRTRLYARAILTEATATLVVTLLCVSLIRLIEKSDRSPPSRIRWFFATCLLLILGVYTRTMLVVWVPVVGLVLAAAVYRASRVNSLLNAGAILVIFGNIVVIGYLPWAIRNMAVTGDFLPMGTQGASQMSAAYGDTVWDSGGQWRNLDSTGFFEDIETEGLSPMQERIAKARYSQQAARAWIAAHPGKTVLLFFMKVCQAFRPRNVPEGVILILSLIGLCALGRSAERTVFFTLIAACAFSIGLTWSVEGRFLVPLLFVWHTAAALGLWWIVCRMTGTPMNPMCCVESSDT